MSAQSTDLPDLDAIENFWAWFSEQAPALAAINFQDVDGQEFTNRVHALNPGLTWELGPGQNQPCAFVLSPGGARDMLKVTDFIVDKAPSIEGWELHAAKPPKQWLERVVKLRPSSKPESAEIEIDFDIWDYSLKSWNRCEFFDITFIVPGNAPAGPAELEHAAWLLVDGELGERFTIERVGEVNVVSTDVWDPDQPCGEVPNMRAHIHQLVAAVTRD